MLSDWNDHVDENDDEEKVNVFYVIFVYLQPKNRKYDDKEMKMRDIKSIFTLDIDTHNRQSMRYTIDICVCMYVNDNYHVRTFSSSNLYLFLFHIISNQILIND